jgi:hypothetical protein
LFDVSDSSADLPATEDNNPIAIFVFVPTLIHQRYCNVLLATVCSPYLSLFMWRSIGRLNCQSVRLFTDKSHNFISIKPHKVRYECTYGSWTVLPCGGKAFFSVSMIVLHFGLLMIMQWVPQKCRSIETTTDGIRQRKGCVCLVTSVVSNIMTFWTGVVIGYKTCTEFLVTWI